MRDIIWTVILVWLIWRIYDAFKGIARVQTQRVNNNDQRHTNGKQHNYKEGEVRIDPTQQKQKPHFKPGDGEYVDYEEIT